MIKIKKSLCVRLRNEHFYTYRKKKKMKEWENSWERVIGEMIVVIMCFMLFGAVVCNLLGIGIH